MKCASLSQFLIYSVYLILKWWHDFDLLMQILIFVFYFPNTSDHVSLFLFGDFWLICLHVLYYFLWKQTILIYFILDFESFY